MAPLMLQNTDMILEIMLVSLSLFPAIYVEEKKAKSIVYMYIENNGSIEMFYMHRKEEWNWKHYSDHVAISLCGKSPGGKLYNLVWHEFDSCSMCWQCWISSCILPQGPVHQRAEAVAKLLLGQDMAFDFDMLIAKVSSSRIILSISMHHDSSPCQHINLKSIYSNGLGESAVGSLKCSQLFG